MFLLTPMQYAEALEEQFRLSGKRDRWLIRSTPRKLALT